MRTSGESIVLPCHPTAPAAARRFARARAPMECASTIELLVSELVTNSVVHAHSDVRIRISDLGDRVRIEVRDNSPLLPEMRAPDTNGGRGLQLVEALADRWGVDGAGRARRDGNGAGPGKSVWFEVRHETSQPEQASQAEQAERPAQAPSGSSDRPRRGDIAKADAGPARDAQD